MKTNGQLLYEHKHPAKIPVRHADDHFRDKEVMLVDNPRFQVPWQFLTQACRDSWEVTAQGHHLFSSGPDHG